MIPLLGKAQLYACSGSIAEAEAVLTQAESLLDEMPAEAAGQWRVHHWLLTRLLQLWKGDTLAMQQTGDLASSEGPERLIAACHAMQLSFA